MRKIAIISIVLLILTSVFPAGAFADGSDVNNTDQSVQTKNNTGNDSDESDLKTDKKTSDVQNEEEVKEQDSDKEVHESDPVENPDVTDSKENTLETNDNSEDKISEDQEVSKEDAVGPKDDQEEKEVLEEEQDSDSNEKKETDSEKKEQDSSSDKEKVTTFSTNNIPVVEKSSTSKLGHLKTGSTIYETIGVESSSFSSDGYLNAVYYIKQQAKAGDENYYLISKKPSSKEGVVGWVKASDMSTHSHVGVDSKSKTFYVKGKGNAYTKAWGGSKDFVYDLSEYKQQLFKVDLTEKVGGNIWYRGQLNGKTVWMHNSYVTDNQIGEEVEKSRTSKLGHLRTGSTIYETIGVESSSFSSDEYLNAAYYIKQQAETNEQTYYLISNKPSNVEGVIGWVKASDMSTHTHVGVDSESKSFIIEGTGNAYNTAWGGSENLVYDLSQYKNQEFQVHLTEKVGSNIWYRGNLDGKTVWMHSSYVTQPKEISTSKTSKLGHLRTGSTIYEDIGDKSSSFSSDGYLNAVYYIKKQAEINKQTYYLISLEPSSEKGVIGWVKASDMSTHSHVGVDSYSKLYYVKGTGSAHSKAWGGKKDIVYQDLSKYQYQQFEVRLTEKVGSNTWFRGQLDGKTVWLHSSQITTVEAEMNSTSKLGHIRSSSVKIYEIVGDESSAITAGDIYTDSVYYIKLQADVEGQTYYLISQKASSKNGVVGWVKADDLSTHSHEGVDRKDKTFYFTGNGSTYKKAWGGNKDLVYEDMSQFKGQLFNVHLTETVGNNVWYRGDFNGETIWLHENFVTEVEKSETSRLGQLHGNAEIYETIGDKSSTLKTSEYTNKVYYIKQQAKVNETYYLISEKASSERGTVGWVKASDMKTYKHVGVDNKVKHFFFTGEGQAFTKAWGGPKDLVFDDLSQFEEVFEVHKTEKVGSNTWYRGDFNGKRIWVHESSVEKNNVTSQSYDLTLDEAWEIQKKLSTPPQTDSYRNDPAYIHSDYVEFIQEAAITGDGVRLRRKPILKDKYIDSEVNRGTEVTILDNVKGDEHAGSTTWYKIKYDNKTLYVHSSLVNPDVEIAKTTDSVNIRSSADDESHIYDTVSKGTTLNILEKGNNWHKISYDKWRNARKGEALEQMDPSNFINDSKLRFQFLDLSKTTNTPVEVLNSYLAGKGTLDEQGEAFIEAGNTHGVNDVYLISHAIHETGNGSSPLAQGIKYEGETVYNMYGVGATDGCAIECGAKRAFKEGWFSPKKAIIGGAKFIGNKYIKGENSANTVQNTLYEMRWNPEAMDELGYAAHQYATDMGWASKQVHTMYNMYETLGLKYLNLEIPVYNKE